MTTAHLDCAVCGPCETCGPVVVCDRCVAIPALPARGVEPGDSSLPRKAPVGTCPDKPTFAEVLARYRVGRGYQVSRSPQIVVNQTAQGAPCS